MKWRSFSTDIGTVQCRRRPVLPIGGLRQMRWRRPGYNSTDRLSSNHCDVRPLYAHLLFHIAFRFLSLDFLTMPQPICLRRAALSVAVVVFYFDVKCCRGPAIERVTCVCVRVCLRVSCCLYAPCLNLFCLLIVDSRP